MAAQRRVIGDRRVAASASEAHADAHMGPNLRFSHPIIQQSTSAVAATSTAQKGFEDNDGDALSILLGSALPLLSRCALC